MENNYELTENGIKLKNDICIILPYTIEQNKIYSIGIDFSTKELPQVIQTDEDESVFNSAKEYTFKTFGYKTTNPNWIFLGELKLPGLTEGNIYSYAVNITAIKSRKPEKNTNELRLIEVSDLLEQGDVYLNTSYLLLLKELF